MTTFGKKEEAQLAGSMEYLDEFYVTAYLQDALEMMAQPTSTVTDQRQFLKEYFRRVMSGENVLSRSYRYVALTPRNRLSFVKQFGKMFRNFDDSIDVSFMDFLQLQQMLCPDFPPTHVATARQIMNPISIPDKTPSPSTSTRKLSPVAKPESSPTSFGGYYGVADNLYTACSDFRTMCLAVSICFVYAEFIEAFRAQNNEMCSAISMANALNSTIYAPSNRKKFPLLPPLTLLRSLWRTDAELVAVDTASRLKFLQALLRSKEMEKLICDRK